MILIQQNEDVFAYDQDEVDNGLDSTYTFYAEDGVFSMNGVIVKDSGGDGGVPLIFPEQFPMHLFDATTDCFYLVDTMEPPPADPAATLPPATEPVAVVPVVVEPGATEPVVTENFVGIDMVTDTDNEQNFTGVEMVTGGEPVAAEPVAPEPVAAEPVAPEPVAPEPVAAEPVAAEPVAAEPVAAEPVAAEPVAAEAVATEPVATEPVATEPVATEPVATEPVATERVVVDDVTGIDWVEYSQSGESTVVEEADALRITDDDDNTFVYSGDPDSELVLIGTPPEAIA